MCSQFREYITPKAQTKILKIYTLHAKYVYYLAGGLLAHTTVSNRTLRAASGWVGVPSVGSETRTVAVTVAGNNYV